VSGATGEINRQWVVETFVNTVYVQGATALSSQKLGLVEEAYPMLPVIGGIGGTLVAFPQVLAAHGMTTSGVGTLGGSLAPVGTIAGTIMGTIAATLNPNQFTIKVYQAPARTLVEASAGTITGALTFLLRGM
jgi:hypothetical protein